MRRRLIWLIIGCLCVGLVSYGAFGLADRPVSAELSKETKGEFVRVEDGGKRLVVSVGGQEAAYPVSATVWVYRNMQKSAITDLKPGDQIDIILNSKDQAAYIKATGAQAASSSPQTPEPSGTAATGASTNGDGQGTGGSTGSRTESGTSAMTPDNAVSVNPTPASPLPPASGSSKSTQGAAAGSSKDTASHAAAGAAGAAITMGWEKLDLEWKSREFELKVKQEPAKSGSKDKGKSEIFLQTMDRSIIHLDGAEADSFIQQLVRGLPAESKAFEAALKQKIASEFQLKNTSPEWKLDIKWPEKAMNASRPQESKLKGYEKEKEQDKLKDQGKGKEKEKHLEKGRGNHNEDD